MPAQLLCPDGKALRRLAKRRTFYQLIEIYGVSRGVMGRWLDEHGISTADRKAITSKARPDYGYCFWCKDDAPGARVCTKPFCRFMAKGYSIGALRQFMNMTELQKLKMLTALLKRVAHPIYQSDWRLRRDFRAVQGRLT